MRRATYAVLIVLAVATVGVGPGAPDAAADPLQLTGDLAAHDPALVAGGGGQDWYVFSTGDGNRADGTVIIRSSPDGLQWQIAGTVWSEKPSWITQAIPGVDNLWAPEVYRDPGTGTYYLYYSASTFGSQRSLIGLATNPTLDPADPAYEWVDQGLVFESRPGDPYNAIDPGIIADGNGTRWMAFGSFWNGIYLVELAWPSGKPAPGAQPIHLATRPSTAIEAPYLVARDGWYYLFVSLDSCCRGTDSTYKIAVGRSSQVTGPYVDRNGVPMQQGGGTVILASRGNTVASGGQSYSDGLLAYHGYGNFGTPGDFRLGIEPVSWTADGWPELS
jgi:arabinan endo-1,5-alpha-L-arabinosidase